MDQSTVEPGGPRPPRATRPPGTLRVGQIGGIDVLVRSSWLFIAVLIAITLAPQIESVAPGLGAWTYVAGLAFAVLLYLSVLLHEVSHALMAKRYGLPVRSITLHFLGGATEIEGEADSPGREFGISVVGPLTSIAVGLVFLGIRQVAPGGLLGLAVDELALANLFVGALNMLPGLPLDGGRVLRAVVWKVSGNGFTGTLVAGWAGRVLAVLVIVLPVVQMSIWGAPASLANYLIAFVIAAFLWSGATAAILSARVRRRLPAIQARSLARRTLAVPENLPLAEAVRRAQEEQAGSIVLLDSRGQPSGIVNEAALLATPEDRRPWLPVSAVSRTMEDGMVFPADLSGEPLIRAMQRTPASEYLLVEPDGSLYGVLVTQDVDRAFAASA